MDARAMKRMKRFVLVQSDEKDPIWKSSDNLFSRMNSEKSEDDGSCSSKEEQEVPSISVGPAESSPSTSGHLAVPSSSTSGGLAVPSPGLT